MDKAAIESLRGIPENKTTNSENAGFLTIDENGNVVASNPVNVPIVRDGKTGAVELIQPKNAVAVFHDHFQGTAPGPGGGDSLAIYKGLVNYVKDLNGNIYKIEFSKAWKTEKNKQNGWKLTKLRGKKLYGQRR